MITVLVRLSMIVSGSFTDARELIYLPCLIAFHIGLSCRSMAYKDKKYEYSNHSRFNEIHLIVFLVG